jgi:hypothetical protein
VLVGPSSVGKSSACAALSRILGGLHIVSADETFEDLKRASGMGVPWKSLKPQVRPMMVTQVVRLLKEGGPSIVVDDNTPAIIDLLAVRGVRVTTILMYTTLEILGRRVNARRAGDRRPRAGVLGDFSDFFVALGKGPLGGDTGLRVSREHLVNFMLKDFTSPTEAQARKVVDGVSKALRLPSVGPSVPVPLVARRSYTTLLDASDLDSDACARAILRSWV